MRMPLKWMKFVTFAASVVAFVAVGNLSAADQTSTAVGTAQAVRGAQTQLRQPPVPGLWGLPFAAEGLSDCDEMSFYRAQWGLPEVFDRIGWRESNCLNHVTSQTGCCRGYWQLDMNLHLADHRIGWRYQANCEVYSIPDAFGDNPPAKQKQACAAKQLYDVMGQSPWAL